MSADPSKALKIQGDDVVMVLWGDNQFVSGWIDRDDLPDSSGSCVTIGIIVEETKESLTIASSVRTGEDGDNQVMSPLILDKSCIKLVSRLALDGDFV